MTQTTEHTHLVTGVDFVTVFVKDFPAASEFYGTTLGLTCSADYGRIPGAEFETGNLTLQVVDAASVGQEFTPSSHPIALHVEDVAAARARLESLGSRSPPTRSTAASATWRSSPTRTGTA